MRIFTLSAIASLSFTGSSLAAQNYEYNDLLGYTDNMGEFHCRYDVEGRLEDDVRLREYMEYIAPDLDSCMEGAQIWANGMHRYYPYYYFDLDVSVTAKGHKDDAYAITHQVFVPRP